VRWSVVGVVVLVACLSGCSGGAADVVLHATDARMLPRYDYDYEGKRFTRAEGRLNASVDTRKDQGSIVAHIEAGPDSYDVSWSSFAGSQPYQSGGATRGVVLYGSTGNGSTELPAFFAYLACFGRATARHNGEADFDPTTTRPDFDARFLVVRGHVRDPQKGIVYNEARNGPYDPSKPDVGFVNATGSQAILQLRTATGELWYHFEFEDVRLDKY